MNNGLDVRYLARSARHACASNPYSRGMVVVGTVLSQSATIVGLMAGTIAVGGFIAHAGPALSGQHDEGLRRATTIGGLGGLVGAVFLIVWSAAVG